MDLEPETPDARRDRLVVHYSAAERARFKAQQRAERLWNLQRQVSDREWAAFIQEHPEYGGWYQWIPARPR
jgi:hypothetical protein